MADFHSWGKPALVEFATEATRRLRENEDTIAELRVKLLRAEVKKELAEPGSTDTIPTCSTSSQP